jgi:hypothetical protein
MTAPREDDEMHMESAIGVPRGSGFAYGSNVN